MTDKTFTIQKKPHDPAGINATDEYIEACLREEVQQTCKHLHIEKDYAAEGLIERCKDCKLIRRSQYQGD